MIAFARLPRARFRLVVIASALVLLGLISTAAGAQVKGAERAQSCLDTISTSAFVRVPVYLEAKAADSSGQALLPSVDTLAVHVAAMIRSSLSESTTSLPEGEMLVQWRQVGGSVRIQLHRDGRFTLWTPPERGDTLLEPSRLLLKRSIAALSDAGTKVRWPADLPGDSTAFDLGYRWPDVALDGTTRPFLVRAAAIPVFSMAMPRGKEVAMLRPPHLTYPPEERASGVEGAIFLEFVVDSAGRVVNSTIKDHWPTDRPRLSGWSGARYQSFVNAAKLGLSYARFEPATLGGCPVKQLAEQPFTFTLQR